MSATSQLNAYLADAKTMESEGSIDPKTLAAVKRVHGKAVKHMDEHDGDLPEAFPTALGALLEGKVSAKTVDTLLKWLLDGGDPAKWGTH